jgi:BolA protein
MASLVEEIRARLAVLEPDTVELDDDSALHAGHPGAAGGGGHFRVRIVSAVFAGENRLSRHRLVYDKLADLIPHRIHALSIDARTPEEAGR